MSARQHHQPEAVNDNHQHRSNRSGAGGGSGRGGEAPTIAMIMPSGSHPAVLPVQQQQQQQRPHVTEAQLRWAQFHHRRRAEALKEALARWYQTPASSSDVPGAASEDGNTSSSSSTTSLMEAGGASAGDLVNVTTVRRTRKKKKVAVSRGRRALLRVSKRAYEQRRASISKRGFRNCYDDRRSDEDDDEEDSSDDQVDALAAIFAEESWLRKRRNKKKKRRNRRRGGGAAADDNYDDDGEVGRIRRFEEAFQALMLTLSAQNQRHEIITATKVWKRTAEPADLDFTRWQLPSGKKPAAHRPTPQLALAASSSGLTWESAETKSASTATNGDDEEADAVAPSHQLHFPRTNDAASMGVTRTPIGTKNGRETARAARGEEGNVSLFPSPYRPSFRELVDLLQQQLEDDPRQGGSLPPSPPRMRLDKFFTRTFDEKKEDDDGEDAAAGVEVEDDEVEAMMEAHYLNEMQTSSPLIEELEQAQPGVSRQLFQLYLQDNGATPFTARRQLLSAAKRQLEVYAIEYLSQHPKGEGGGGAGAGQDVQNLLSPESAGMVRDLVERLEGAIRREPKIWQDGKLHKPEFARLVREYLLEARRQQHLKRNWRRSSRAGAAAHVAGPRRLLDSFPEEEAELGDDGEGDDDSDDDPFAQVLQEERNQGQQRWDGELDDGEGEEWSSFVESFVNQMPDEALVDSSGLVTDMFKEMVARYLEQATKQTTPVQALAQELVGGDGEDSDPDIDAPDDEPHKDEQMESRQFAQEFVRHLQRANAIEPVFTPEGKLVSRASLEKFVSRFVEQSAVTPTNKKSGSASDFLQSIRSPELLARARQMSGRKPQNRPSTGRPHALRSPGNTRAFVQCLQAQLEQRAAEAGPMSAPSLQGAVEHALREVTTKSAPVKPAQLDGAGFDPSSLNEPLFDDLEDFVQPFVAKLDLLLRNVSPYRASSRNSDDTGMDERTVHEIVKSCLPPPALATGGVFVESFMTKFTDTLQSVDGDLNPSSLEGVVRDCARHASSAYDTVWNEKTESGVREHNDDRRTSTIADAMSGKLGGLLSWYRQSSQDTEDEMHAVAAFRSSLLHRQGNDDNSSLSSFRVPDGFKKVVESFRRNSHVDESSGEVVPRKSHLGSVENRSAAPKPLARDSANFTADSLRMLHQKVKEKSALVGDSDSRRSIIDTDGSEASFSALEPAALSSLLLSPTILTKRLQQAIRAVEARSWEQVSYLMNANPWLAEMMDLTKNQFLLHKVALYGTSTEHGFPDSPDSLNHDLLRLNPSAVHKFDNDGNLPLHMAAASANHSMIRLLGESFPSGASVRNEDGMLPLHLVLLASASLRGEPSDLVKQVIALFPGAVAVADNDGNLPIHIAANALKDSIGADAVYVLLDEADRQVQLGARFRSKVRMNSSDNASLGTETADSMADFDEERCCSFVRNEAGLTPLMVAIRSRAGWKVIEALVSGTGGSEAVMCVDFDLNNALHLLVDERWKDPKAVMSILRVSPAATRMKNASDMIPFEIACMQGAPREVLLAMVLVDLPFDLDDIEFHGRGLRDGFGASWVFLTCECDDAYVDVVEEALSLCSYPQSRELCFFDVGSGETLLARATPKCRTILQRSLRFLGRFEFVSAQSVNLPDFRVFDAIDFGTKDMPLTEGKRVILKCYVEQELFELETKLVRDFDLDFSLLEEVSIFAVGEDGMPATSEVSAKQFCISIEEPSLTLLDVMNGMLASEDCQMVAAVRKRYAEKIFAVLRLAAKALRHLHSLSLVHGSVSALNCAKYGSRWKLRNVLGIEQGGVDSSLKSKVSGTTYNTEIHPDPMADVWDFGMLAFEILVGERLFFDKETLQDELGDWNRHRRIAHERLVQASVSPSGAALILTCLHPDRTSRPTMADLLRDAFWKEFKRPNDSQ